MQIFVEQRKGTKFSSIIVPKENQYLSLALKVPLAIYLQRNEIKVHLVVINKISYKILIVTISNTNGERRKKGKLKSNEVCVYFCPPENGFHKAAQQCNERKSARLNLNEKFISLFAK